MWQLAVIIPKGLTFFEKFVILLNMEKVVLNEFEQAEDMQMDGLKIVQDTRLYRFTSDSVLLSKFARVKKGDKIADFCSGSGIVAFHTWALHKNRMPSLSFTLFEMQPSLMALSKKTAILNEFENFAFVEGKLQDIPKQYRDAFSLVLCNPPYERGGLENECYEKAVCRKEITLTLEEIAKACAFALKFGGRVAMLHRADRVAEVIYTLKKYGIEVKRMQFVCGREDAIPYLVMVEGVKGGKPAVELMQTVCNKKEN